MTGPCYMNLFQIMQHDNFRNLKLGDLYWVKISRALS